MPSRVQRNMALLPPSVQRVIVGNDSTDFMNENNKVFYYPNLVQLFLFISNLLNWRLQWQDQNSWSTRHAVQNELDRAMIGVLQLPDTDVYEKAQKHAGILQQYLLMRQGEREKAVLTLSLPDSESNTNQVYQVLRLHPVRGVSLHHFRQFQTQGAGYVFKNFVWFKCTPICFPKHSGALGHCRI